jgi:polyhydroxyalkanoate synthesis regulator phasin
MIPEELEKRLVELIRQFAETNNDQVRGEIELLRRQVTTLKKRLV